MEKKNENHTVYRNTKCRKTKLIYYSEYFPKELYN